MIRKALLVAAASIAMVLSVLAAPASAQGDPTVTPTPPTCTTVGYNNCVAYPTGGFGNAGGGGTPTPTPTPRPLATATPVSADDADATTGGGGDASIAFTGAESRVLGYVGAGMIGFGAVALAAARRKSDD
jgi:hypothetical protein